MRLWPRRKPPPPPPPSRPAPLESGEERIRFDPDVVLDPLRVGCWHSIGGGIEVRIMSFDHLGTIRVRRAKGPADEEVGAMGGS